MIDRGLTISSISRIFGTVRAVINLTIQEHGLDCRNAFANIYMPRQTEDKRQPIPKHEIIQIQKTCLEIGDERRLVIALISDTGMRLSEALGLVWSDVELNHEYPHINLVEHLFQTVVIDTVMIDTVLYTGLQTYVIDDNGIITGTSSYTQGMTDEENREALQIRLGADHDLTEMVENNAQ